MISDMVSSEEKNYKYFIGYMDDEYRIKLFSIILLKTSAFLKVMIAKLFIQDDKLWKKI